MLYFKKQLSLIVLLSACLLNTSCVATAVMGGAAASSAAFDERSLGQHIDDVYISSQVDARLISEKNMPSRWVSVQVIEGTVILTGYLPSQQHIERAAIICRTVPGVLDVTNELHIGQPTISSLFSDSWITTQVKNRFFGDKLVSGMSLHVETVNGKVYLQGILSSEVQRYRAVELSQGVQGVTAIVDLLRLARQK
ncbi:MAG: BON domain-containing protein [Mariprofundaceae bacterium]